LRNFLLSFASIIAALSLFSVGAARAETSDEGDLPAACQLSGTPATPSATATGTLTPVVATVTPTATVTATTATNDDEESDNVETNHRHAIRACIAALHEDGDHGIGEIVSELAHELNAERHAERDRDNDEVSPPAVATDTSTPTTTTEHVASVPAAQPKHEHPTAQHGQGHGRSEKHGDD
jgi:hypothetical protein